MILVVLVFATIASAKNQLSEFCTCLAALKVNCKPTNALCDTALSTIITTGNYSSKCNSDSPFDVDIDLLQLLASKCQRSIGEAVDKKYLWMTLFVKNDARNVIESIVWHLLLGVDHIVIYDNSSEDNLVHALGPFINALLVSRIPWSGVGIPSQQAAYRDSIRSSQYKHIFWLAIIDVDEFILPVKDKCLPKMLSRFESHKNIAALALNWRMMPGKYELSHRTSPYKTTFERTEFSLGYPNRHIKTILRPSRTNGLLTAHAASYNIGSTAVSIDSGRPVNDSFNYPPQVRDAVILHYHVKSLEEWVAKKYRWSEGMDEIRCPACHQPLEGIVKDWLKMKKFENLMYVREYQRHCDNTTDENTIAFMRVQSAQMKSILVTNENYVRKEVLL